MIFSRIKYQFLVICFSLFAVLSGCGTKHVENGQQSKPNVLFISVDDLNDWIGVVGEQGNSKVKTPNLDRLAAMGVYFKNAHANVPVCEPSRLGVMTGLDATSTGCYSNSSGVNNKELWNQVTALPALLRQNGYFTMGCGKLEGYLCNPLEEFGPNEKLWDERLKRNFTVTNDLLKDGGGYHGIDFYPFPKGGSPIKKHNPAYKGHSLCAGPIDRNDLPLGKMPDELTADWAIERLERNYNQPFMLGVGFVRPHVPYTAPQKYFDMYPLNDIAVPEVTVDEMDDIPAYGKAMAYGAFEPGNERIVRELGPEYRKKLVQGYMASVTFLDDQVGRLIDALELSKHANNTIIVLWSDHGQHLGEKRSWRKNTLWQESTNSPMIWVVPGMTKKGQVCHQPASLLDIYPTLNQLCQLNAKHDFDGLSLAPQLKDATTRRTVPAITSYSYGSHSARGERWHYIRYYDGSEELYDGQNDYNESINLASDPQFSNILKEYRTYIPEDIFKPNARSKQFNAYNERARVWNENPNEIPDWLH
ncbi:MAG: sulfatase [Bacteroidales bacterium]|nr:sulfatase [Bacteroidales bacterium]